MKFDYSKALKLTSNVPNLHTTIQKLAPVATHRKVFADKCAYIFSLGCGIVLFSTIFNIDLSRRSNDYSHSFKIYPDFLTGTRFVAYRKDRKQFIIY